jgi:group I intron endonuclease
MIGIYKITSPSGRVYVGQSTDVEKRWENYNKLQGKGQTRLYRSFIKHSVSSHTFEVVEECTFEELNVKERYWQEYYKVLGIMGLNCRLVHTEEKSAIFSEETRKRLSEAAKGKKKAEKTKELMSNFARNRPKETREKITANNLKNGNRPPSRKGTTWTPERREKNKATWEKKRIKKVA